MNKIEINLDATALGHSSCILDLYRTVVGDLGEDGLPTGGYRAPLSDASLIYGVAVHKFIDVMYKSGGIYPKASAAALASFNVPKNDNPKKAWLSDPVHLKTVCYNLWSGYVEPEASYELIELIQPCWVCRGSGQVENLALEQRVSECPHCKGAKNLLAPASEITFKLKYYEDDNIIVNLCGTIDGLGKFKNGCYAIRDWKTTSSWDNEGYFKQYELSRQLRMYLLSLKLMAAYAPESILGKMGHTQMGVFIDAIFLKTKPNDVQFARSEIFQISASDLDAFQLTLDDKIRELSQAVKTGYLPKQGILNGTCIKYQSVAEKNFVKCAFWDCCRHNDNVASVLLKRNFIQKHFDPLKYNEV